MYMLCVCVRVPSDLVELCGLVVHIYITIVCVCKCMLLPERVTMAFGQQSTYRIYNKLLILITFRYLRDEV